MSLKVILVSLFVTYIACQAGPVSQFTNKVVLLTGGSTGIGYETAKELAGLGAHVVFCARDSHPTWYNGSHAEKTINDNFLTKAAGGSATFFKADIRNSTQIRHFIAFTHKKFGRIDYAVNNAGIGGWVKNIDELEDDMILGEHDSILNNLYGVLNLLRYEVRYFKRHGNPNATYSIVNMASFNGIRACAGCSLYAASKHGIIGLTQSVAIENINSHPKIRVNAVAPGYVNTELTRNQAKADKGEQIWEGENITEDSEEWKKFKASMEKTLVGGRIAEQREISKAIIGLLDERASYVSGVTLSMDNGLTAANS